MSTLPLDTLHDLAALTRARMAFLCAVAHTLAGDARVRCSTEMGDLFDLLRQIDRAKARKPHG